MLVSRSQRLAEYTTIHAVRDFYYGNLAGKLFWGSLAACAVTGLFFQLETVMMKYYDQHTGAMLMQFTPQHMPGITICPDAWVSKEKAESFNFTETTVAALDGFFPFRGMNHLFEIETNSLKATLMYAFASFGPEFVNNVLPFWTTTANRSLERLVDLLGIHNLTSEFRILLPKGENLAQSRVITFSGVCFRFEKDTKVMNYLQSVYAGLKVVFHLAEEVLAPNLTTIDGRRANSKPFYRIFLGKMGERHLTSMSDMAFAYGRQYMLAYSVTKITRINTRRWPCKKYTSGDHTQCLTAYGNNHAKGYGRLYKDHENGGLGCETALMRSDEFEENNVTRPCSHIAELYGSSILALGQLNLTDEDWNNICPRPCEEMSYQYTAQEKKEWSQNTRNSTCYLEVKAAQGMSGMVISEYLLLTIEGMLSNVGGTLGLWLGSSVMSMVQVFYLLCLEKCMAKKKMPAIASPKVVAADTTEKQKTLSE